MNKASAKCGCVFVSAVVLYNATNKKLRIFSIIQCDSFGTRPKKMRISQRLFIRF